VLKVDVAVVGGGPAGSTAAALCAKRGLEVAVFERDAFPRFHIGESLLPQSQKVWEELGVTEQLEARFLRKYGARFIAADSGDEQHYRFAQAFDGSVTYAYEVERAEFDDLLLKNAVAKGAKLFSGWSVQKVRPSLVGHGAVDVRDPDGTKTTVAARVIVDATGRDGLIAAAPGKREKIAGLDNTAVFAHWQGVRRREGESEGDIDIVCFPHGWFWNIPFKGGVNSVGVVCRMEWMRELPKGLSPHQIFDRAVEQAPWMQELISGASRSTEGGALADFSYRVPDLAGDGWVAVGDATGFIDPLFSTGAHLGFVSGSTAARAIAEGLDAGDTSRARFAEHEASVRRGAGLFVGAVQSFYEGTLQRLIFTRPQKTGMRRMITSMLAGDVVEKSRWTDLFERFLAGRAGELGDVAAIDGDAEPRG
jgi:flavin-dependent dehydrogenase